MIDKDKMIEELKVVSKELFDDVEFLNNALCVQLILMVWKGLVSIEEAKIVLKINQEDAKIMEAKEASKKLDETIKNSKVIEVENGEIVEEKPEE